MYSINFLNKPGIQNFEKFDDKNIKLNQLSRNDKVVDAKVDIVLRKKYTTPILLTFFVIFFLGFIYKVYISNNFIAANSNQNMSISYVLKMLRLNGGDSRLLSIDFLNDDIKVIIQCSEEDCIYEKLKLLNDYDINAKALISENNYFLHIKDDWIKEKNRDWNLHAMQKYIEDFNGISSEIFNNRLIVVCDYKNLVKLFEIFDQKNLSTLFDFKIEIIEKKSNLDKDYYKILIQQYD